MDTDNAASFAEPRKCTDALVPNPLRPIAPLPQWQEIAPTPTQIDDARRNLTLAALRWQAALDAHGVEVS